MRRSARLCACLALAACLLVLAATARAEESPSRESLKALEEAAASEHERARALREESERLRAELTQLRPDLVDAAAAAQTREQALARLERELGLLAERQGVARADLRRDEAGLVALLAALERMSWRPAEAIALSHASLTEASRSALLFGAVAPALKDRAERLKSELAELAALRRDIDARQASVRHEAEGLAAEHRTLARLFDRQSELLKQTEGERRAAEGHAAELAGEAEDLRELLAEIERKRAQEAAEAQAGAEAEAQARTETVTPEEKPPTVVASLSEVRPEQPPSITAAEGSLVMPAAGRLRTGFDETNSAGLASNGLVIETRANAVVVAPFDGEVVFAGPFRGYGPLLIIEHGEDYYSLLAGLGRIDCVLGQWLLAGQPVGVMGPDSDESPTLYVEMRRGGQPIDPLPWMAPNDKLARG